jgi:peptidoglycan hydrolase CwlO-like protein
MKKAILLAMMFCVIGLSAFAQTVVKKEDKVKKTTTVPQKVHNVFSKHKHYSGTKTKHVTKVEKPTN